MVSVPDWARFARMLQNQPSASQAQSKYFRQRELDTIRQAEEQGYFLNASKSFIENTFAPDEEGDDKDSLLCAILGEEKHHKDLLRINFIRLINSHLRNVGEIGLCQNLTICILSGNYIQRFDALIHCTNLMRLSLHNNQISMLPGPSFWNSMLFLRILHLHDNPIGKIENLSYLAACPCLFLLTLFDTPLSLKRNYRHHVVNSIWSLKALDENVISDEEIIEDAEFNNIFASCQPPFGINLVTPINEDSTFEEECIHASQLIAQVNNILAHYSPVLIIQRYTRGYLVRKQYKVIQDMRIWAAVTIQRGFRDYKGIPHLTDANQTGTPPPPTSPIMGQAQQSDCHMKMIDYDTYIANRRPGSTAPSESSTTKMSFASEESRKQRRNIFINLTKLQSGTLSTLQDEMVAVETVFPSLNADKTILQGIAHTEKKAEISRKGRRRKEAEKNKQKIIKTVKYFLGPVVERIPTPIEERDDSGDQSEEIPVVNFRLRGMRRDVEYVDPVAESIMTKREAGHEVRLAESKFHIQADNAAKPTIPARRKQTEMQRFAKIQGFMGPGLSCLRAVQQAYKDRSNHERTANKIEYVMRLRDQRESAKERGRLFHEEKRRTIMKERESEHKRLLDVLEKKELAQLNYYDKKTDHKNITSHFTHQRKGELTFMSDFNMQNTSVSNALMRHDRQAAVEDRLQEKTDQVLAIKQQEREQQEIVRKYMEHRQLMTQTESAMTKASLDTKALQEANERLMQARQRVAQQKARHNHATSAGRLPSLSSPGQVLPRTAPHPTPLAESPWAGELATTKVPLGRPGLNKTATVA